MPKSASALRHVSKEALRATLCGASQPLGNDSQPVNSLRPHGTEHVGHLWRREDILDQIPFVSRSIRQAPALPGAPQRRPPALP